MKYKGIKEACSISRSYCQKDGRGETVAIWREGSQIHWKVIPNGWFLLFDDGKPEALYYTNYPMTMKEIEMALDGGEENGKI